MFYLAIKPTHYRLVASMLKRLSWSMGQDHECWISPLWCVQYRKNMAFSSSHIHRFSSIMASASTFLTRDGFFKIHFRWKILVFKNQTTANSLYKMWIPTFIKPAELWRPYFHYQTLTRPEPLLDQYINYNIMPVFNGKCSPCTGKKYSCWTTYRLKLSALCDFLESPYPGFTSKWSSG